MKQTYKLKVSGQVIDWKNNAADLLVVGIPLGESNAENTSSGQVFKLLDTLSEGFFSQQKQANRLPSKAGQSKVFYDVPQLACKTVVLVGFSGSSKGLLAANKAAIAVAQVECVESVINALALEDIAGLDRAQISEICAKAMVDASYVCDAYRSQKETYPLTSVIIAATDEAQLAQMKDSVRMGKVTGRAMNILKDLGNAPGNVCTPRTLSHYARDLAESFDCLSVQIHKEEELTQLGMGALLSVGKGSKERPRLIEMQYQGATDKNAQPIVLVGKGVTFDSGGISLKPGPQMDEMKYDMCGAGSVIATMYAVAKLALPINVVGVIPAVENMPDGRASKPGDIVTSMSGQTIEILNTDAEGRLILCDALTYVARFKPQVVIDIATLTGACIIALGHHASGVMGNDAELLADLVQVSEQANDQVWQLPLLPEYDEAINSPFADMQNIGSGGKGEAGSVVAGSFLARFTQAYRWAHLDIAGTAWIPGGLKKGATGRPVPTLLGYIRKHC